MKKSKFITGLSAAFVGLMALASCSIVKASGDVLLYYNGKAYTAEDLFKDHMETPEAASAAFNAVYKVAVRNWATKEAAQGTKTEIENLTKNKMLEVKEDARSNAEKNGTSYDYEFKKILSSNGVDSEAKLFDKFEYDFQKEKFEDKFYEDNYNILKNGGKLFEDKDHPEKDIVLPGYLNKRHPYHIKHILIKTPDAAKNNYTTGTISDTVAKKISDVAKELATGTSFGDVAKTYSEDDGSSGEKRGDLGIMDVATEFVDDFKLGTYMYESFFGSSTQEKSNFNVIKDSEQKEIGHKNTRIDLKLADGKSQASKDAIALSTYNDPSSYNGSAYEGIGVIPYEACELLGKWATDTFDSKGFNSIGIKDSDANKKFLPRNVIFNKYFNRHNVCVITPAKLYRADPIKAGGTTLTKAALGDDSKEYARKRLISDTYRGVYTKGDYPTTDYPNFIAKGKNDDSLKRFDATGTTGTDIKFYNDGGTPGAGHSIFLHDNEKRPIFVVKSEHGIHFICIERSATITNEYTTDHSDESITLDDYYTIYYPGEENGHYPQYKDESNKNTFVNHISGLTKVEMKERAKTVKSKLKESDPNLNKYIFDYLVKSGKFVFSDKGQKMYEIIEDWRTRVIKSQDIEDKEKWDTSWEDYKFKLDQQLIQRKQVGDATNGYRSKLVPDLCAEVFEWANPNSDVATGAIGTINKDKLLDFFGKGGLFNEEK